MSVQQPQLAWTGERMIPFASDYATEATHWQRYLYFRPWYEDAKVVDVACGEGYGTDYASIFATKTTGVDVAEEAVAHANAKYPFAQFEVGDATTYDFSDADFVTSFETIEHLPDPEAFLESLKACKGRIVISTPNRKHYDPNAKLGDKPTNPFHTIEWTTQEFADLINKHFPDRQVRFLTQQLALPGRLVEGLNDDAWFTVAVIGDGDLPKWPKIGMSIPTVNNAQQGIDGISAFLTYYPGEIEFAVVLNGTDAANRTLWQNFAAGAGGMVHLVDSETNVGYGRGANLGLAKLQSNGGFDLFAVCNDDVYPSLGCMTEMAYAFQQLDKLDQNPGIVGVVSNNINGRQQVEIGEYSDLASMMRRANNFLHQHRSSASPWLQIRGLCFLMNPACLDTIGGFDPIFGLGNFEDDDLCLRAKLAGFTNWIVDGAYLFHQGSKTFAGLQIDYSANIARNAEIFIKKWEIETHEQFLITQHIPENQSLYVPLDAVHPTTHPVELGGGETVDLLTQASDVEFAYWVYAQLRGADKATRIQLLNLLTERETAKAA